MKKFLSIILSFVVLTLSAAPCHHEPHEPSSQFTHEKIQQSDHHNDMPADYCNPFCAHHAGTNGFVSPDIFLIYFQNFGKKIRVHLILRKPELTHFNIWQPPKIVI